MRKNLVGEDGDIVAGIRFSSDVEILLGVLGELVEEERKESIDILAGSNSVADRATAVGVTDVDRLVKEDNGSVVVPRVGVVDKLNLLVDGCRTELKEETGQ